MWNIGCDERERAQNAIALLLSAITRMKLIFLEGYAPSKWASNIRLTFAEALIFKLNKMVDAEQKVNSF